MRGFVQYKVYTLPVFALIACVAAQESDTRAIVAEEFIQARPAVAAKPSGGPPGIARAKATNVSSTRRLGLTVWRLRPASVNEPGARILVHENGKEQGWIPERVSSHVPLRQDDRIRLTFESAAEGYLYVVDREQFANGSFGEPHLIFPTSRTRKGDNHVVPGRLVEIPDQEDRPNYLTLRTSRADQVGEQLSLLVSQQPLEGVTIGKDAAILSSQQFALWQKSWATTPRLTESVSTLGKAWTKAEQEAGADRTRLLTHDDPGPQTIYTVLAPESKPVLVTFRLQIAHAR